MKVQLEGESLICDFAFGEGDTKITGIRVEEAYVAISILLSRLACSREFTTLSFSGQDVTFVSNGNDIDVLLHDCSENFTESKSELVASLVAGLECVLSSLVSEARFDLSRNVEHLFSQTDQGGLLKRSTYYF